MKKYLILMLCIILICAMPTLTYATEETAPITESEFTTEEIVEWVKAHLEEISVVVTLIVTAIYNFIRNNALGKSMTTVNNNAVTIATNSKTAMDNASRDMGLVLAMVNENKEEMSRLIAKLHKTADEKKALEDKLDEVTSYLKTAKLANVEFANELAELLVLANIPNAVKEELYARHRAAVNSIADAEKTEVVENEAVNNEAA